jgi:hypothetical protein
MILSHHARPSFYTNPKESETALIVRAKEFVSLIGVWSVIIILLGIR